MESESNGPTSAIDSIPRTRAPDTPYAVAISGGRASIEEAGHYRAWSGIGIA